MKTTGWFYLFCALFLAGWTVIFLNARDLLMAYAFVAFCVAWAIYRLPTVQSGETLRSFFLYERKMPRNQFIGTLVTTNVGFFSSVAFSTVLIVTLGIGPAIIAVLAWIGGLIWFASFVPKLLGFFRSGSTVHEFIARSYGRTESQQRHLRFYSSVITFFLYVASVGAEIKFTSQVFSVPTGLRQEWLAFALCLAGVLYVSISGYRGVVSTDRLRFWAIMAGICGIYTFVVRDWLTSPPSFPTGFLSVRNLTFGPSVSSVLSLIVLLVFYQFCVMDMWERCIAIVNSDFGVFEKSVDEAVVGGMRRMIAWSIIPFILLFGAWYGLGLTALGHQWAADPNQIIPNFLIRLREYAHSGFLGSLVESLVVLCFSAAALSTIDGFIIAAVQTIVFDWLPSFRKDHKEIVDLDPDDAARYMRLSRLLVLIVGVAAVAVAFLSFGIMSFWVGMYSLMLSFFPAILLVLVSPVRARLRSANQVAFSIVSGSAAALCSAIAGTFFFTSSSVLMDLPPFLAVGVASVFLLPVNFRTETEVGAR